MRKGSYPYRKPDFNTQGPVRRFLAVKAGPGQRKGDKDRAPPPARRRGQQPTCLQPVYLLAGKLHPTQSKQEQSPKEAAQQLLVQQGSIYGDLPLQYKQSKGNAM